MKVVSVFSVQFDNGYVLKNFGNIVDAVNYCRDKFPNEHVVYEDYDEKNSLKNFY